MNLEVSPGGHAHVDHAHHGEFDCYCNYVPTFNVPGTLTSAAPHCPHNK